MRTSVRRATPTSPLFRPAGLLLTAGLLLSGCGGSTDAASTGVASLDDSSPEPSTSAQAEGDTEQQLLDFVQCLRDQGLDVPDPQVDAEGNLQLGGPGGGGPGEGGDAGGGGDAGPGAGGDPEQFQTAAEQCGGIPDGALGGAQVDQSERQDAALAFAQCMREQGLDVADPDFSGGGGGPGSGGGPFGGLDVDDPQVQAALEVCQTELPTPGGAGNDS